MGRSGIIRTATVCLAATLLGTSIDAGAAIRVAATAIRSGATHGSDITLTLRAAGEGTTLDLRAKQVQIDGWTAPYRSLRFACTLARDAAGQWACDGAVQARRGDARLAGTLALASNADGGWRVALRSGSAHASVVSDTTTPAGFRVQTQALPVAWIEDVLKALLPTYRFGAGTLDTDILVHDDAQALHTDGTWTLSALGVDSDDGEIGAAALDATGTIAAQWRDAGTTVDLSATLARGGVLVSPLYAEVGAKPVALQLALQQHAQGWHVTRWQLDDPDAIVASGSAELGVDGAMGVVDAKTLRLTFPGVFDRYLTSIASPAGFGKLATRGGVQGALRWTTGAPLQGDITLTIAEIRDPDDRFGARGLDGNLHLGARDAVPSRLAWQGGTLYGIPLAAGAAQLAFGGGDVKLLAPLEVGLLGGTVALTRFQRTRDAQGVAVVEAALSMTNLSVAALAKVMDWPEFGGTLSGTIPAVRGTGDRYTVDGTLALDVFDGHVALSGLQLERPFGVAPSLSADVAIDDLDLQLVTQAFSFGSIDGRLDGRMNGLRLVDWTPVAFDARFRTDKRRGEKQRLSQRAVNSLSSVGGGGAGVQASLLKIFENFGYDEIGIDLALNNNVVTLAGLDTVDGGYTIVRGSGIPRLSVVGHQRRVDWQVLVARLKAATEGTSPVIK